MQYVNKHSKTELNRKKTAQTEQNNNKHTKQTK